MDTPSHRENEERRQADSDERDAGRLETPFVDAENGEPIRIHVVSWVNSTMWRVAVAAAFFASLFSIYDNSQRVKRLESQVCSALKANEEDIRSGESVYGHPDSLHAQRALGRVRTEQRRFHCPDPKSPVVPQASEFFR